MGPPQSIPRPTIADPSCHRRPPQPSFIRPRWLLVKPVMFLSGGGQVSAKYLRAAVVSIALAISFSFAMPSFAAGSAPDRSAVGTHGMVVSESEQATNAGVEILKRGGNAIDAAVATAPAVGDTNP